MALFFHRGYVITLDDTKRVSESEPTLSPSWRWAPLRGGEGLKISSFVEHSQKKSPENSGDFLSSSWGHSPIGHLAHLVERRNGFLVGIYEETNFVLTAFELIFIVNFDQSRIFLGIQLA